MARAQPELPLRLRFRYVVHPTHGTPFNGADEAEILKHFNYARAVFRLANIDLQNSGITPWYEPDYWEISQFDDETDIMSRNFSVGQQWVDVYYVSKIGSLRDDSSLGTVQGNAYKVARKGFCIAITPDSKGIPRATGGKYDPENDGSVRFNSSGRTLAHELGHILGLPHTPAEYGGRTVNGVPMTAAMLHPFEDDTQFIDGLEPSERWLYVMALQNGYPADPRDNRWTPSQVRRMHLTLFSCYDRTWLQSYQTDYAGGNMVAPDSIFGYVSPRYVAAVHAAWMG